MAYQDVSLKSTCTRGTTWGTRAFEPGLFGLFPMLTDTLCKNAKCPEGRAWTPHGFRAMARTIMVEKLNIQPDVIEAQLAHGKSGPLGAAYDRAEFMTQRRQMMRVWADYLDELRQG